MSHTVKNNKYFCLYLRNHAIQGKKLNRSEFLMIWATDCNELINLGHQKMCTVKKTQKSLNTNILVLFGFKNKTKKWNSIFAITVPDYVKSGS